MIVYGLVLCQACGAWVDQYVVYKMDKGIPCGHHHAPSVLGHAHGRRRRTVHSKGL